MTVALEPHELIAAAVTAALAAVMITAPIAAGVLAVARDRRARPGLGIGIGLLAGLVIAAGTDIILPVDMTLLGTTTVLTAGLLCAMAAAVLILARRDGSTLGLVLGIAAAVFIGFGEPGRLRPALFDVSDSVVVVLTALVVEGLVIVVLTSALVLLGARLRAVRRGVAAAALVAAVLTLLGTVSMVTGLLMSVRIPVAATEVSLIAVGTVFVITTIVGAVLAAVGTRPGAEPVGPPSDRRPPPARS